MCIIGFLRKIPRDLMFVVLGRGVHLLHIFPHAPESKYEWPAAAGEGGALLRPGFSCVPVNEMLMLFVYVSEF